MKNPRFEDSNFGPFRHPDINKIECATCAFRAKDRVNGQLKGATLDICDAYDVKPSQILFGNGHCTYYAEGYPDE